MDYKTLSHFSIVSMSDQTDYLKYPYITGNMLAGVLPEQAAVWSYPIADGEVGQPLCHDAKWVGEEISEKRIALNMINSFLGRMHLASHLELLSERQFALVKEGVAYYNSISEAKKQALPYFPNGFTQFGAPSVVAGFKTKGKVYLAVYALGQKQVTAKVKTTIDKVRVAYPLGKKVKMTCNGEGLEIDFSTINDAVFLEIEEEN